MAGVSHGFIWIVLGIILCRWPSSWSMAGWYKRSLENTVIVTNKLWNYHHIKCFEIKFQSLSHNEYQPPWDCGRWDWQNTSSPTSDRIALKCLTFWIHTSQYRVAFHSAAETVAGHILATRLQQCTRSINKRTSQQKQVPLQRGTSWLLGVQDKRLWMVCY